MPKHVLYPRWQAMIARCTKPEDKDYHNYGGRGIKVCDRWLLFDNFLVDVGMPPFKNATMDRINSNGNYELSNFRWATRKEQALNRNPRKLFKYCRRGHELVDGNIYYFMQYGKQIRTCLKCFRYSQMMNGR